MARKRMLHPEFFSSASLAQLDVRAMLTFAGLWVYCDDYGRGEDDAAFIASSIWPRREEIGAAEVEDDLAALASTGTLCRYRVGGAPLLHIPSWLEHQRISHPTPSKLPPCPRCDEGLFTAWWRDDDTRTDRYRRAEKAMRAARTNGSGEPRGVLRSRSGMAPEEFATCSGTTPSQSSSVKRSSVEGAVRALLWVTPGLYPQAAVA